MLVRQELKQENTERPAVSLLSVALSVNDFWRHRRVRAGDTGHLLAPFTHLGYAKVTKFDCNLLAILVKVQEKILELDVSMHYASLVAVVYGQ